MRVDGEQRVGGEQKGVAIGRGTCHGGRTDVATGPGLVLDHDGLLEDGLDFFGRCAHDQISGPAGWKRNDDFDGALRPGLGQGAAAGTHGQQSRNEGQTPGA